MKEPGESLNGLEQAEENWFSDDGNNQFSNALDDTSIQSSPFPHSLLSILQFSNS